LSEQIQVVVHNGIDTSAYRPAPDIAFRRELGVPGDGILVGALGNVRVPKDYGNLLDAAAILKARSPRYRFAIVGDTQWEPTLYQELLAKHAALGLGDAVIFAGFRPDAPRLLNNFDLYVMSSEREGLPLALAQAMATGLPVVSTRAGGAQELITSGLNGVLAATPRRSPRRSIHWPATPCAPRRWARPRGGRSKTTSPSAAWWGDTRQSTGN
jgi:glycosyltransferase involved in cell wall biosynthesis